MAFLIGGANSTSAAAHDVENGARLFGETGTNAGTYFQKQNGATANGNQRTWTISIWLKKCGMALRSRNGIASFENGSDKFTLMFNGDDKLDVERLGVAVRSTNRIFRDPSAWYHIVCAVDTTDGTADDRMKIYVNGVLETSFGTKATISQNYDFAANGDSVYHYYGVDWGTGFFDGYIAEVAHVDGTQYAASNFGEFDEDSGIWKPKSLSGISWGNNGSLLEFKESGTGTDASGLGADTSGNDRHFSLEGGTGNFGQVTDTPTNNFCTLNSIAKGADVTLTQGNLKYESSIQKGTVGTMGVTSGKWYFEAKAVDVGADTQIGVYDGTDGLGWPDNYLGVNTSSWGMISGNGKTIHGGSLVSYGNSVSDNDIIMVAIDMDNDKWFAGENGTWHNSGDPAAGDNAANGGIDDGTGTIFPAISNNTPNNIDWQFNFGNPIYANSSDAADANGYGAFEYAPPSGFYALCTKNLAEFGG